jgi:hypothetical protein
MWPTICRPGSGDFCDVDELCTGNPDEACPTDVFEPATTECRPDAGVCDAAEQCPGVPGDACPDDFKESCSVVTDSSLCSFDVSPEKGSCVDIDGAPTGEACDVVDGDPACTTGTCVQSGQFRVLFTPSPRDGWPAYKLNASNPGQYFYNLVVEGTASTTQTVTLDVPYPFVTQGAMPGHVYDAVEMVFDSDGCFVPPALAGTASVGYLDFETRADGSPYTGAGDFFLDNEYEGIVFEDSAGSSTVISVNLTNPVNVGTEISGYYVNVGASAAFSMTFLNSDFDPALSEISFDFATRDGQIRVLAFDAVGAVIHDESVLGTDLFWSQTGFAYGAGHVVVSSPTPIVSLVVETPIPEVLMLDNLAFTRPVGTATEQSFAQEIAIEDYIGGVVPGGGSTLACDQVGCGFEGVGTCSFEVEVPIPASGQAYVNLHLNYGLKGSRLDANDGQLINAGETVCDGASDRYDAGGLDPDWGGFDALANTATDDGPIALPNCTTYVFSHDDGATVFEDEIQSVNEFKRISGAYGRVYRSDDESGVEGAEVALHRIDTGELIEVGTTTEEGFFTLAHKHTGPKTVYTVTLADSGLQQGVQLKANGWAEVNFDLHMHATSAIFAGQGQQGGDREGKK